MARRWDLLDLLLEWGAAPERVDLSELFGTYQSKLFRRFRDLGVDLTADHALARALAYHTSNKPLFGFAKRERMTDPKVQHELDIALVHHAGEGNERGVALCLWAGADPYAPAHSLRYNLGSEDDEAEGGFRGFSAVWEACRHGDVAILERMSPDPALDDFDDVYDAAENRAVIRFLAQQALPSNLGARIHRRLRSINLNFGFRRWHTIDPIECLFEIGCRWKVATKEEIAAVRWSLLKAQRPTRSWSTS